jgi:hypothetical protein
VRDRFPAALAPSTLSHSLAAGSPIVFATQGSDGSDQVTYVVAGDVNGDGTPDLVTGHGNDADYIAVQLGLGDGTFAAPTQLTTSDPPNSIAIADVNGDGIPDLIASEAGSNSAFVFFGLGSGAFGVETSVSGSMGAGTFVVVADLNGDGILDLALAYTNGALIALGNGDGTFPNGSYYAGGNGSGSGSEGLAVADFNNDGIPDVIVSNQGQGTLSLFLGVGDGTLKLPTTITLPGTNPTLLTAADLRRSGTQDIVVTDSVNAQVYVLLGNNDGTFQNPAAYPIAAVGANQALVADVTNDGIPDLVVAGYGPSGAGALLSVLPGLGNGVFGPKAVSHRSSAQKPCNSAMSLTCVARFQPGWVLIVHAPFDNARTYRPCLQATDGRRCRLSSGCARDPTAAAHKPHPTRLGEGRSHGCDGRCAALPSAQSSSRVAGRDRIGA